jgi:hypothetical protein
MTEEKTIPQGELTKFNMGLATLENIRNLLNFYHKVSIMDSIQLNNNNFKLNDTLEIQIIKSRTCIQLLLASRPLLKDNQKLELEKLLSSTEIKHHEIKMQDGSIVKRTKYFSYSVDKACDFFVSKLEDLLQDNKVFMPGKGESSLF